MDVDHEGRISNPEVLAAVPDAGFADAILKSIHTARFTRASGATSGCRMESKSHLMTVVFSIG